VVAVAAVVVLGAVGLTRLGGDDGPPAPEPPSAADAYLTGAKRLLGAWSFSFKGVVRAGVPSRLRPGPAPAYATVEGSVQLPLSITRERAIDASGRAVEVATSGSSVWTRSARRPRELDGAAWAAAAGDPEADRLGLALVADAIRSGADAREVSAPGGRRVLRAGLPADDGERRERCRHCRPLDAALAGGQVTVALDADGDITRADLIGAGGEIRVQIELHVVRSADLGALDLAGVAAPPRDALRMDDLEAAGITPVELGTLPDGWALTDASVGRGTARPPTDCQWLELQYHDIAEAWRSEGLSMFVTSAACPDAAAADPRAHPFAVGTFTGSIGMGDGVLSDGTTRVRFASFLPDGRAAALLASLQPFSAAT
jgi:hypothetical protein